jgi:hypothetical protein
MPYLGDYLGHLLSEITNARVQADLESVRVADLYASHPLLKHMAVPRFRLPNVTIDAPVVMRNMDEAAAGQPLRGGISMDDVHQAVERALASALNEAPMPKSARKKNELRDAVRQSVARFAPVAGAAVPITDISAISRAASDAFADQLGANEVGAEKADHLRTILQESIAATLHGAGGQPVPRLHVAVTNAELREAGPPDLLARLHLTVSEEAMEWSVSESNGTTTSRLVVE